MLEQNGLEVYLVNARHTKNLPGRKSDVQECQWLLKLHAFGLLSNSFQPTNEIRIARTLWRQRASLVAEAGSAIQRMQKVLTEMNIQLGNVLSDLSGVSGMKIIGAILEGQRDPWELAALARPEVDPPHPGRRLGDAGVHVPRESMVPEAHRAAKMTSGVDHRSQHEAPKLEIGEGRLGGGISC